MCVHGAEEVTLHVPHTFSPNTFKKQTHVPLKQNVWLLCVLASSLGQMNIDILERLSSRTNNRTGPKTTQELL